MKFKIRFADQISGIFVLLSLIFLAVILIFMGLNQRWFVKDPNFTSRFSSAKDLKIGMDITFKGFKIGSIDEISLDEDNSVSIYFHIFKEYTAKVTQNSVLELSSSPIGLGSGLVFYSGKSTELIELIEDQVTFIPSLDSSKGQKLLNKDLVNKPVGDDTINNLIGQVGTLLTNVDTAVVSLNDVLNDVRGTFSGSMTGPVSDILTNVDGVILDVGGTISGAENMIGNVNGLIGDLNTKIAEIAEKAAEVLLDVKGITSNLEETTSALKDPTGIVTTLLDPKGSIAKILDDDNILFEQIEGILAGIDDTINQLKEFSSFINNTSPQISGLLEEGKSALDQGKDVLEGIKNNPLLRGGIAEEREQQTTFESYRDEDF